jgi:hypothetical protein
MPVLIVVSLALLAAGQMAAASSAAGQPPRDVACTEWHDCQRLALAAADRREYEAFHDLAWRAVQTGPPKDPSLMYLLARAQALSGRPHDAQVMLERLADMGVASDAATNDDFARTRQLPGWPELSARIARLTHPSAPPPVAAGAVAATAASVPPEPASPPSPPIAPTVRPSPAPSISPALRESSTPTASPASAAIAEGSRFSTEAFTLGGLAYDTVSRRFLVGDRLGRKLRVVGEGANHAVDFVRADSAGFRDIAAIEIDGRRGDLWVISAAPADGAGTLHKLQLVSGRPLKSFPVAADLEPVTPVDLAVTPAGMVLVLDSAGRRLLALRPGATAVERVLTLDGVEPVSLAAGGDEGIAYVAHRDGVSRIDLRARTATRLSAPAAVSLAGLEQIRWRRHALIAIRVDETGIRRVVRLELNASGRAVTHATDVNGPAASGLPMLVAISGDELVYMVDRSSDDADRPSRGASGMADFVMYHLPLR